MSRIQPLPFQTSHVDTLVARFRAVKLNYDALGAAPVQADLMRLRHESACVLLQAPTGIGKTLMACELMSRFSPVERVLWLWFAPFTGVLGQAKATLKRQAPNLTQLDIESDRQVEKLTPGAVFVLSWQTVAARTADTRLARQSGDVGMSVDELILQARHAGYRIGVVVDEAHHGFVRATEAGRFFGQVLTPDYVLLMTATPRDADAARFAEQTGYRIGGPVEWASVSRAEGVAVQLLKPSVKVARFIAQNQDDAQLLVFEEVAMSECAVMHRIIKRTLAEKGIGLVPLMLVQVPNGAAAMESARKYIVDKLRFPAVSVRVHTADEPDPNLAALADDPEVEVILFKMAIATGFDAPRAFSLAALRGTRSADFGIQVVGRILRVHRLLQGRLDDMPSVLRYGYVFLANSQTQEGLVSAAQHINQMPAQLASASPSTVVTIVAGQPSVQLVQRGESYSLMPDEQTVVAEPVPSDSPFQPNADVRSTNPPSTGPRTTATRPNAPAATPEGEAQGNLFQVLAAADGFGTTLTRGFAEQTLLTTAFELEGPVSGLAYALKPGSPLSLTTERLPALPENFEERLVSHIDFSRVLGDRLKVRTKVVERTTDLFTAADPPEDRDVWATVSPTAIAERARQIAFAFDEVDRRELLAELKKRFRKALTDEGHEVPDTEEELTRQLELVLVRNDKLVRTAYKRLRSEQVTTAVVNLPPTLTSDVALVPAARNVYGVFPPSLLAQEREFAEMLDTSADVIWWHRNPVRKPESVALYGWAEGIGFFPDFVVKVVDRTEGGGVALSELKGPQLQQYDRAKAGARHVTYGRVFMVGKPGVDGSFRLWRLTTEDHLVDDGLFEVQRLRFS